MRREIRTEANKAQWGAEQRLQAEMKRRQVYKKDAERLLELATSLQEYVTATGAGTLSQEMTKEAGRAARMAHELRKTMAGEEVAKIKSASQPERSAAAGHADWSLANKTSRCLNLATSLKKDMDQYLDPQNINTISVQVLQQAAKPAPSPLLLSMMTAVDELERLTHELARSK